MEILRSVARNELFQERSAAPGLCALHRSPRTEEHAPKWTPRARGVASMPRIRNLDVGANEAASAGETEAAQVREEIDPVRGRPHQ